MAAYTLDDVIYDCKKHFTGDVSIIKNTDGTISVYENTNISPTPFILSKTCCEVLDTFDPTNPSTPISSQGYYFDLQEQKCRWRGKNTTTCDEPIQNIKVILNPHGNDGSIFDINGDENCSLRVKFKYLIKFDCADLANVLVNTSKTSSSFQNQEVIDLKNKLEEQKSISEQLSSKLSALGTEYTKTNYSIVCDTFPYNANANQLSPNTAPNTSANTITLNNAQKSAFSKTGFGDLAPMSFALPTRVATFCIINDGLDYWKKILGDNDYIRFIEGDPNSYTCKHVIEMYNLNLTLSKEGKNGIIVECDTPFGTKTALEQSIAKNITLKKKSDELINEINAQISAIDIGIVDMGCTNILDYFENLTLTASIDVVNNDGTLTSVQPLQLFGLQTTLYNWLTQHSTDSGFYVCGYGDTNNTSFTGCTPIIYPEFSDETTPPINTNTSVCETVKNAIYDELFAQSGYDTTSDYDSFNAALSPTILASDWLSFDQTLSGDNFISQIANKKIKLSININNSCGVFCLLVDQITLQRECNDTLLSTIIFNESPGFNLTKVIDNKKSWLNNTEYDYRDFSITNVLDTNPIRQTEYDVNDDRLVINTKEIDLNMDIASAVEYDVWCYLSENPCTLSATTCTLQPSDIYGNSITLPTAITTTVNCSSIIGNATKFLVKCNRNYESVDDMNICFPTEECLGCGRVLKIKTNQTESFGFVYAEELWVVCDGSGSLSFYYISDNTDTQNTIENVTTSFTSNCLQSLTNFVNLANTFINPFSNFEQFHPSFAQTQIEIFWNNDKTCRACCITYGDSHINLNEFLTDDITQVKTIENFEYLLGDFIDAKSRKILSGYPTLRAVYDRYLNSSKYCGTPSLGFDYYKMDEFSNLITTYWDDLIEQVIPSTTLWGSIKVYTNTLFDQQKFKYRPYSSLFCNDPLNAIGVPSPINGSSGQCETVEVITRNIPTGNVPTTAFNTGSNIRTFNKFCLSQFNYGSEFIGNVNIMDGDSLVSYSDFCDDVVPCEKSAGWYNMQDSPEYLMNHFKCGPASAATDFNYIVQSFTINGTEYITTPLSGYVTNATTNWVAADNLVVSACTGTTTGLTYTNFVDLLNDMFTNFGVDYRAEVSLVERTPIGNESGNGMYLIFPTTDVFSIVTTTDGVTPATLTYTKNYVFVEDFDSSYYIYRTTSNYNCLTDEINE